MSGQFARDPALTRERFALRFERAAVARRVLAAAGPQWNPPLATAQASAPLALLIDDGWAAAATWDTRTRTAADLITRAETDNRGVATIAPSIFADKVVVTGDPPSAIRPAQGVLGLETMFFADEVRDAPRLVVGVGGDIARRRTGRIGQ